MKIFLTLAALAALAAVPTQALVAQIPATGAAPAVAASTGLPAVVPSASVADAAVIAPASVSSPTTSTPAGLEATAAVPSAAPVAAAAPHAEKTSVMVMNFESGTVSAQVKDRRGFGAILAAMRGDSNDAHYDPAQLGTGIADMLVEKLLETDKFRLMERKALESVIGEQKINAVPGASPDAALTRTSGVLGARYMITGSVTRFGFEEHNVGGFVTAVATFGMLSFKKHRTEVRLTARVIDTATGEIIASMHSEGASNKGGGLRILGMGANGGGGGSSDKRNFRETAIGEATERAVNRLVEALVAKRDTF